jgi:hypothetical protein
MINKSAANMNVARLARLCLTGDGCRSSESFVHRSTRSSDGILVLSAAATIIGPAIIGLVLIGGLKAVIVGGGGIVLAFPGFQIGGCVVGTVIGAVCAVCAVGAVGAVGAVRAVTGPWN